jgi:hypothetical protein
MSHQVGFQGACGPLSHLVFATQSFLSLHERFDCRSAQPYFVQSKQANGTVHETVSPWRDQTRHNRFPNP